MADSKLAVRMTLNVTEFTKNLKLTQKQINGVLASFGAIKIGASIINAAKEYQEAFQKIRVGTGATGDTLKALNADFRELTKTVPQSQAVTAQALADVNTRLGLSGEKLREVSKSALDLSRILGEDTTSMIASATRAINSWGFSAADASLVLDKLYTANYNTGISVTKLGESLSLNGSILRSLGMNFDEAAATLASFEKAGVDSSAAITAMTKSISTMSAGGVKDFGAAIKDTFAKIKNAKSDAEATGYALEIFGKRAGAKMASAVREGRFSVEQLTEALKNSQGAIKDASDQSKTFEEKLQEFKKNAAAAFEPLGQKLLEIAEKVLPKLQTAFEDLSESGVLSFSLVLAGLGTLTLSLGSLLIKIQAVKAALLALGNNPYFWAITGGMAIGKAVGEGIAEIPNHLNNKRLMQEKVKQIRQYKPDWDYNPNETIDQAWEKYVGSRVKDNENQKYAGIIAAATPKTTTKTTPTKTTMPTLNLPTGTKSAKNKAVKSKADKLDDPMSPENVLRRIEEQKSRMEQAAALSKQLRQEEYDTYSWQNQNGLMDNTEYFDKLRGRFEELKAEFTDGGLAVENYLQWTDEMKDAFSELQNAAENAAAPSLDSLKERFNNNVISTGEYTAALEKLKAEYSEFPAVVKQIDDALNAAKTSHKGFMESLKAATEDAKKNFEELGAKTLNDLGDAFARAIAYGDNLGESLKKLGQEILYTISKMLIMQQISNIAKGIGGLFGIPAAAKGRVYGPAGEITAFARGGVVNSPTVFPFANGVGLMGEAGPEAIMPLTRNGKGQLGVRAENLGGTMGIAVTNNITINNNGGGDMTNEQAQALGEQINKAVEVKVAETMYKYGRGRMGVSFG